MHDKIVRQQQGSNLSGWIHDGLRILTGYFGTEDDVVADQAALGDAGAEPEAVTEYSYTRRTSNITTTKRSERQKQQLRGAKKRKAADTSADQDVDPVTPNKNARASSPKSSNEGKKRVGPCESKNQEQDAIDADDAAGKGEVEELHPLFALHLQKLKRFIAEHGHMKVPTKDKTGQRSKLLRWMIRQRVRYMALPNAYCNHRVMTQAEIDALNALGFQWEDAEDEELHGSFAVYLDELKQFVAEHGHMNVPLTDHAGTRSSLRNWMVSQRLRYRALPGAYHNNRVMTRAEIDALNEIGFQWELPEVKSKSSQSPAQQAPTSMDRKRSNRQAKKVWLKKSAIQWTSCNDNELDEAFRKRLVELREFVAEHGHMKPPSSVNGNRSQLYNWMNYQRLRRRASPNRYRHCRPIRQAEIDALDALGFDWEVGRTPSEPEVTNSTDNRNDLPVTQPSASKRQRHSPLCVAVAKPVVESTDEEELDACFQERLHDLLDFQSKHGHLEVKSGRLYHWSKHQRLRRRAFPKRYSKRSRPMTQAEINALDAVGFDWRGANDDDYDL